MLKNVSFCLIPILERLITISMLIVMHSLVFSHKIHNGHWHTITLLSQCPILCKATVFNFVREDCRKTLHILYATHTFRFTTSFREGFALDCNKLQLQSTCLSLTFTCTAHTKHTVAHVIRSHANSKPHYFIQLFLLTLPNLNEVPGKGHNPVFHASVY